MKLNFGSGKELKKGFVNVDKKDFDLDIVPYPYKDNSVDEIWAENVLEHLKGDLEQDIFPEWYRISRNGALWTIIVPHGLSPSAWATFSHIRGVTKYAFDNYKKAIQYGYIEKPIKFKVEKARTIRGFQYLMLRSKPKKAAGNYNIFSDVRDLKFAFAQLWWKFIIFKIRVIKK